MSDELANMLNKIETLSKEKQTALDDLILTKRALNKFLSGYANQESLAEAVVFCAKVLGMLNYKEGEWL